MTPRDIATWISTASYGDLERLAFSIAQRREQLCREAAASFTIGDAVRFNAKTRGVIVGVFKGVAQKNALVEQEVTGTRWRVSPILLQRA